MRSPLHYHRLARYPGAANVSDETEQLPRLCYFYQRFLSDEDTARFVAQVGQQYTIGTLERLAEAGGRISRRAATLALTFLGDFRSNAVLGRRMADSDRGVRVLAENGIRDLWLRDGSVEERQWLAAIVRANRAECSRQVLKEATRLLEIAPTFAEVLNQRAIARFHLKHYRKSVEDCRQVLDLNPYHFAAAVGMANCYLELNNANAALESFRRALKINPGLEAVRTQVHFLERALEER
jgi:tetratricopeptide (TPR) repeat protein